MRSTHTASPVNIVPRCLCLLISYMARRVRETSSLPMGMRRWYKSNIQGVALNDSDLGGILPECGHDAHGF